MPKRGRLSAQLNSLLAFTDPLQRHQVAQQRKLVREHKLKRSATDPRNKRCTTRPFAVTLCLNCFGNCEVFVGPSKLPEFIGLRSVTRQCHCPGNAGSNRRVKAMWFWTWVLKMMGVCARMHRTHVHTHVGSCSTHAHAIQTAVIRHTCTTKKRLGEKNLPRSEPLGSPMQCFNWDRLNDLRCSNAVIAFVRW